MNLLKHTPLACASLLLFSCQGKTDKQKDQYQTSPNIIIFMADDMGYADLGCYGSNINTPNIDSLAEKGIRFTNFYAAAPNCSPSRAALLTGRFSARVGMYSYRPGGGHVMHLKDKEVTIAELLKKKNYQTGHFGKWHLSCLPQDSALKHPQPKDQGFDYSLGTENNARPSHKDPVNFVRSGKELGKVEGYSCQIVADEIKYWFENEYDSTKPFFHCVWFHEPHKKVASPPELTAHYPDASEEDAKYFANIENLDMATGRILQELKKRGLYDHTLIIVTSDNGPYRQGSQGNLRGLKGEVYDGGIKVPGIICWKNYFTGGKTTDKPAGLVDILPTITDICNIKNPASKTLDGVSLAPLLNDKKMQRNKPLFWFFYRAYPEAAMRSGDYNMVGFTDDTLPRTHHFVDKDMEFIKKTELTRFELYNLDKDPGQQNNIINKKPELADSLKTVFIKLFEEVTDEGPYWEGLWEYEPEKARKKWEYVRE